MVQRYQTIKGTVLITVGAVLIGYFGAIQETQHSLDELLSLYARPAFVAFATIAFLVFVGVLAIVSNLSCCLSREARRLKLLEVLTFLLHFPFFQF